MSDYKFEKRDLAKYGAKLPVDWHHEFGEKIKRAIRDREDLRHETKALKACKRERERDERDAKVEELKRLRERVAELEGDDE